jgi:AraC-like DNA-binding protein
VLLRRFAFYLYYPCMPLLLFACSVGILFFALVQLLASRNEPLRNLVVVNCFLASYIMAILWATATGKILHVPFLADSDIAVKYPVLAIFFLAARIILREGRSPFRSFLVYFIPPVALAAGAAAYSLFAAPAFLRARGALPGHYSNPFFMTLTVAADILWLLACILLLLDARRIFRAREVRDTAGFRHQVVFISAYAAPALVALVADSLRSETLYNVAAATLGVIWMGYALTRTTAFYLSRDRVAPRRRMRRPHWDSSAADLDARLSSLMETEAPYTDETLDLGGLSGMLGVEPKRLSYHLNLHHEKTFRSYVNDLRLAAVGRDLLEHPRRSILDTAFANGFNSKSTFNELFYKKYGKTPKEFRRGGGRRKAEGVS